MTITEKIIQFLSGIDDISLGYSEINFFNPKNLDREQIGYSVDPKGNSLITGNDGDWQKEWMVIASDQLGDPILLDTNSADLTVLTAAHGEGAWEPFIIADSLNSFKNIITMLHDPSKNRTSPVELENNPITKKVRGSVLAKIAKQNSLIEIAYWENFFEND